MRINVKSRKFLFLLIVFLLFLFVLFNKGTISSKAAGQYFDVYPHGTPGQSLDVNECYYIKNVHTAQYITVKSGSTAENTEIVQSWYHGGNSQKWLLKKQTTGYYAGYYYLVSALDGNKALAMSYSSGDHNTPAVLKTIDLYDNLMYLSLSPRTDTSYYLRTNATGNSYSLNVKNSSFAQLTKIQQKYYYDDNCAWLFEPASEVKTDFGVNYAYNNWRTDNPDTGELVGISTYPCFQYSDCANFVSQCLNASGLHYAGIWAINKWNDNCPFPTGGGSTFDASWKTYTGLTGGSPWISAVAFQDFWSSFLMDDMTDISVSSYYLGGLDGSGQNVYGVGDVVQILKKDNWGRFLGNHTLYITSTVQSGNLTRHLYTAHSGSSKDANLAGLINIGNYYNSNMYMLRFYDFTQEEAIIP